jgi:serine protease Do
MRRRIPVTGFLAGLLFMAGPVAAAWATSSSARFWTDQGPGVSKAQTLPDFADLAAKLSPAVVNISSEQESTGQRSDTDSPEDGPDPSDQPFENYNEAHPRSLGSGFVINKNGYILTNDHVVTGARQIVVSLRDGHEYRAKVVGEDTKTDVALIKIDVPYPLPVAPLGDSDVLRVGEWVMAIGNPFGFDHTVTAGIVSAKGRFIPDNYDDFIQTDASINPGNSGGPLIDLHGAVVGVNSAIFTRTGSSMGIGFAIPVNLVKSELPQLRDSGHVIWGWIGIEIEDVPQDAAARDGLDENRGALVKEIMADSPAAAAGLQRSDIIVEFDHHPVAASQQLQLLVGATTVGRTVPLKVIRNGQAREIPVTILASNEAEAANGGTGPATGQIGAVVSELGPQPAHASKPGDASGVVVSSVERGSLADTAGLKAGDIILEVNRHRIRNLDSYEHEVRTIGGSGIVLLLVKRETGTVFIPLKFPG